jgi:hypothetical protein
MRAILSGFNAPNGPLRRFSTRLATSLRLFDRESVWHAAVPVRLARRSEGPARHGYASTGIA